MKRRYVVVEVSRNWPPDEGGDERLLGERFEAALQENISRGYVLHSWRLDRVWCPAVAGRQCNTLNETIIAVFVAAEYER